MSATRSDGSKRTTTLESPATGGDCDRPAEGPAPYGRHRALLFRAPDGRVVLDPGSAAPPRFNLKPSVAILTVTDGGPIDVRFIEFV